MKGTSLVLLLVIILDLCKYASTQGSINGIGGIEDVTNSNQSIYRRRKRIIELKKKTIVRLTRQNRKTPSPSPPPNTSTKNPANDVSSTKSPSSSSMAPKQTNAPKNHANPVVPSVTKAPSPTYGSRYTPSRNKSSGVRSSLTLIISTISVVCVMQLIVDI